MSDGAAATPPATDEQLLARARQGEAAALDELVTRHSMALVRLARRHAPDAALADDVVQDAWLAALRGLPRFEGRSSLRAWLCRIVLNRLRSRLRSERRTIPFSELPHPRSISPDDGPAAPRKLARPYGAALSRLASFGAHTPEDELLASEARALIEQALATLPPAQREVVRLRDIEGWDAGEVCTRLHITESNQRVLLHRGRLRVRSNLERYLSP